ncbi:MAG: GntR family transcriptional regulator [Bacteroidales bacterium]|nr:GntR family transcriptional regulator [Bacteroidales bacterium]
MIELGKYCDLKILRNTGAGFYLGDESGEEVLLPNRFCPKKFTINEVLKVFVHHDNDGQKVASSLTPKLTLGEFALLKAKSVADGIGAFMDWGVDKDLMVPFREQKEKIEAGRWYIVYLDIDLQTNRLYGSCKIENFVHNEILTVSENQEAEVLIWKKTDLGYSVIVNNIHIGLVFDNEIFKALNIGDKMKGWVKNIREDNKIDISLQAIGYDNFNDSNTEAILKALEKHDGFLPFTDKSAPEEIYTKFGISKKAFKKAIGALFKQQRIEIKEDGINLV